MQENEFIDIKNQLPPLNKAVMLKLFDKWRGEGLEVEILEGTYDGVTYRTKDGKDIWHKLIVGWRFA